MLIYPHIKRIHKGSCQYNKLLEKSCIVQEKLDGCNFRVICKTGAITFGSRQVILEDDKFCNFGSIKEDLLEKTAKVKDIINIDFMVVGELIGYNEKGLIMPRIKYFSEKVVRFYAFEIFDISNDVYIDFERAQEILDTAGFNTIPYEKCNNLELLTFTSKLFPHLEYIEGYVLRCDNGTRYKIKSDKFQHIYYNNPDISCYINDNAFFDYISKGYDSDPQKFHEGLYKEIIDNYFEDFNYTDDATKKTYLQKNGKEIFNKSYFVILRNTKGNETFEKILKKYDVRKARQNFVNSI